MPRFQLPRLGIGTAPLGHLYAPVEEAEACSALRWGLDHGVRLIDTAPLYGRGLAEQRVGLALEGRPRSEFVVSTKVGRVLDGAWVSGAGASTIRVDFSRDGIFRALEQSLNRLKLEYIDIALVHDPDDAEYEVVEQTLPALAELRASGVVGMIGVGMNQAAALTRIVKAIPVDVILCAGRYTLLDQTASNDLFPACMAQGVQVLAAGIFNSGILAFPGSGARYNYQPASQSILERARAIQAVCLRYRVSLKAAAVQFPLRHPAVASVLVGIRSLAEVEENVSLATQSIPSELWVELEASGFIKAMT